MNSNPWALTSVFLELPKSLFVAYLPFLQSLLDPFFPLLMLSWLHMHMLCILAYSSHAQCTRITHTCIIAYAKRDDSLNLTGGY